jgi:UTP--glucose-1-phosphate uridylyltransferase
MRPATDAVPKVLLPVGLRPMLDWALDEALATGVDAVIVVVAPQAPLVRRHAERRASENGWPAGVALHIVEQPAPLGLGDALIRCRALTGEDSFGVVVPDNWFDAETPALLQVAQTRHDTGLDTLGLIRVTPARAGQLGNVGRVELAHLGGENYRIVELGDKQAGTFRFEGDSPVLRGCARYALGPTFYDALEATGPPPEGEWDDVPAFQHLTRTRGLAGRALDGLHFDVGQPAGYLAAMSHLFGKLSDSGA